MAANVKITEEEGTIKVTNIAADKQSGSLIVVGELVCCHKNDQLSGALNCPVWVKGVEIEYNKIVADDVAQGAMLYYDDVEDKLSLTAGALKKAGIAAAAAPATTATKVRCHLGLFR